MGDELDARMRETLGARRITGNMLLGTGSIQAHLRDSVAALHAALEIIERSDTAHEPALDELRAVVPVINGWGERFAAVGDWLSAMHDERERGRDE